MTTSLTSDHRSPRFAAQSHANDTTASHETTAPLPKEQQPSSTVGHRRSPRLAGQQHDARLAEEQPSSESWNETGFDPYDKPSSPRITRSASKSQSIAHDSAVTTTLGARSLDNRKVAFGQEVRQQAPRGVHVNRSLAQQAGSFVTPASHNGVVPPVQVSSSEMSSLNQRLSTVTPHEHEASLALAALCMQSDKRKNVQRNHYLGGAMKPAAKQTDAMFPRRVYAMVMELDESAPDVLEWISGGEAFVIHKPKSPKLATALQKYFAHGNYGSLQRQLNMYGWRKPRKGKCKGGFYNKHFHRDPDKADLRSIRRHVRPGNNPNGRTRQSRKRKTAVETLNPTTPSQTLVAVMKNRSSSSNEDLQDTKLVSVNVRLQGGFFDPSDEQNLKESLFESSIESPITSSVKSSVVEKAIPSPVESKQNLKESLPESSIESPIPEAIPSPVKSSREFTGFEEAIPSPDKSSREFAVVEQAIPSPVKSKQKVLLAGVEETCSAGEILLKSQKQNDAEARDTLAVSMSPQKSPFSPPAKICNLLGLSSPIAFDGIDFSSTLLGPSIPADFDVAYAVQMNLHDGQTIRVSPLEAVPSVQSPTPAIAFEHLAVLGTSSQQNRLPSPVELTISPPSRVPPPFATSPPSAYSPYCGSAPTPLSLSHSDTCSPGGDGLLPLQEFSAGLSSLLFE